jgi:hypothetical protein
VKTGLSNQAQKSFENSNKLDEQTNPNFLYIATKSQCNGNKFHNVPFPDSLESKSQKLVDFMNEVGIFLFWELQFGHEEKHVDDTWTLLCCSGC